MPVSLSIKNVPEALAQRLRERAERNHRSLQRELMTILEHAARSDPALPPALSASAGPAAEAVPPERLSIDRLAARAQALFPRGSSDSVDLIREMRDGRYGAGWARTGRNPGRR